MKDDDIWIVSYYPTESCNNLSVISMIASKEFGEAGRFNGVEAQAVVRFILSVKIPRYVKHDMNDKTWDRFRRLLNRKIYKLYNK